MSFKGKVKLRRTEE